jgi:hypothetical protein
MTASPIEIIGSPGLPEFSSQQGDFDEFWLSVNAINKVNGLINTSGLPTMALGADTLPSTAVSVNDEIADLLITDVHENLLDETVDQSLAELKRPIPIGYNYGKLIAIESNASDSVLGLVVSQRVKRERSRKLMSRLRGAVSGVDPTSASGVSELATRLREIEVRTAGSDVLASGMLGVQLHMRQQFLRYHQGEPLANEHIRLMQTLFYAGALAGGLLNIQSSRLRRSTIETTDFMLPYTAPQKFEA